MIDKSFPLYYIGVFACLGRRIALFLNFLNDVSVLTFLFSFSGKHRTLPLTLGM